MKNIQLALIYYNLGILFLSCQGVQIPGNTYTSETTLIIQNISDHNVRITAYLEGKNIDEFTIKNNAKFTKVIIEKAGQSNYNNIFSDENNGYRDSVLIIFDEKKAILFHCPDVYQNYLKCSEGTKNIAWIIRGEYQVGRDRVNFRKKTTYRTFSYPITKEDYAQAVPIEDLKK